MMYKKKKLEQSRFRLLIQIVAAAIMNGYLIGFMKGKIFKGNSKGICVPVLNCYSCPGAIGSCPIGSLQAVLGGNRHNFSFYVLGFIMLFGVLMGRLICGFLCPFGLVQDLLYKIPTPKLTIAKKIDNISRYVKYFILVFIVILMPIFITSKYGIAPPYFCKWICPVGIFEGALPLISSNESLKMSLGFLFNWKLSILVSILILGMLVYRPFCKYLCPLGAMYALFNKFSFYQMKIDELKCTNCKICEKKCKMNIEVTKNINSMECIRCGECISLCPTGAISVNAK